MDKFIPIKISDVGSKFKVGGGWGETYRYIDKQKKITKKKEKIMVMSNFAQKVGGLSIH